MSVTRADEYRELVVELQNRYQDVPAPARHAILMTASVALAESFCLEVSRRSMTEEEFVVLARRAYRTAKGIR